MHYGPHEIADIAAAIAAAGHWLQDSQAIELVAVGHRVVHGGPDHDRPVLIDQDVLARLEHYVALAPLHQPNNLAPIRTLRASRPDWRRSPASTRPFIARMMRLPTITQFRSISIAKVSGGTDSTGFPTNTSPVVCPRWRRALPSGG
jgi:hypothetical protein